MTVERRADGRAKHGQISADQTPFRHAAVQNRNVFFVIAAQMLPAGFASMTVRKKDCRVNSGKSLLFQLPGSTSAREWKSNSTFLCERKMQRGDVAVTGKYFRVAPDDVVIQPVENPR